MDDAGQRSQVRIVWLRRDLRLRDNAALAQACEGGARVALAFVVDPKLLAGGRMSPAIVQCFFEAAGALRADLRERGSDLAVLEGSPAEELTRYARTIGANALFYNEDYDPQARLRDAGVTATLETAGIEAHACTDHVYFGAGEVLRDDGTPYRIFTPYRNRWLRRLAEHPRARVDSTRHLKDALLPRDRIGDSREIPSPQAYGFTPSPAYPTCSESEAARLLRRFCERRSRNYKTDRDFPALDATSHLSPQLRAGTIGIRTCIEAAVDSPTWLDELIWREFYQAILSWYPHVDGAPFVPAAANVPWRDSDVDFGAWCAGETGYPIVDAAMRCLNQTGWMHNRLRMIAASFLTKDLLIDWRRGERYFEQRLADADLAANNGGWQWSASTGTDAAPYFRVFNPVMQSEKFDPAGEFIREFVPELRPLKGKAIHAPWKAGRPANYPEPIVDHSVARTRAIAAYSSALANPRTASSGLKRPPSA